MTNFQKQLLERNGNYRVCYWKSSVCEMYIGKYIAEIDAIA